MHILRHADLDGRPILLLGHLPHPGRSLVDVFTLPAARRATAPLTEADLRHGTVVVSTLPNIQRHACVAQIVQLEEECAHRYPSVRIVHVSQDEAIHWREVDRYHGGVTASSYTLSGANESSRVSFTWAFGVGVLGHKRIAHGLFALRDGLFIAAEVPFHQMHAPDVRAFLGALDGALREERRCL
jgi:peroxiredoxin